MSIIVRMAGGGIAIALLLHFAIREARLNKLLSKTGKPSKKAIEKRSAALLAQMDRNVAERNARKTSDQLLQ